MCEKCGRILSVGVQEGQGHSWEVGEEGLDVGCSIHLPYASLWLYLQSFISQGFTLIFQKGTLSGG